MAAFSFEDTERFLPLRIGRTARETLQEFIDIDVTASDLSRILNENQAYRDLFFRFVNKKAGKKEKPKQPSKPGEAKPEGAAKPEDPPSPTHRLVSLLGMIGSRNLILAIRIHRLVEGFFPVTENGEVEIVAAEYLKRALAAEELFAKNKLTYSETAFAAGVYFDLSERIHANSDNFKQLEKYYNRCWQRSLRTGLIAYLLAERLQGFTPRTALAAGMLAHGGKLHLAVYLSKQNYAQYEEILDSEANVPALGRLLLEREKFGLSQEKFVAHTLRYFDVFGGLAPIVGNFREPYVFKGLERTNYNFCVLLNLADNMARSWKIPADDKDPVFNEWSYPGLAALRVRRTMLIEVMKRAMSLLK